VAAVLAVSAMKQTEVARDQRHRAEEALAATERGLLRAQTAELRAMIERLDLLKENATRAGDTGAVEGLERERQELLARLDKTTHLHQAMLAQSMGFRGDFDWLSKWEGEVGGVKLFVDGVMIDPDTYLARADEATIRKRYEYLLSPEEMEAVAAMVGKKGDEARAGYDQHRLILERIRLKPADVAQLVPEAVEPWWNMLVRKYPEIAKDSTPACVQTALLSFAFNMGMAPAFWNPLTPAITSANWLHLADLIEHSLDGRTASYFQVLRKRRLGEASLIRACVNAPVK
jgi:hypothetical protein